MLQVGIIGASPNRGWARISHVPAVQGLDGLALAAVATRDQPSADEAARQYGAARAFGDPAALIADPAIDIVTVAVNVPAHRALVLGALAAGKHVFCEYPLGRDAVEARLLADAARGAGTHVATGLQLRENPAARRAKAMIASGAIGRVLSARVLSTAMAFGPRVEAAMAFGEDAANGVTLPTIQGAHTVDLAVDLLGPIAELSALGSTQFPEVEIEGSGRRRRTVPDHLLVTARLAGGAPLVVEVVGGRPAEATPFRFEIIGETGTLLLMGGAPRGVQSGVLTLSRDGVVEEAATDGSEIDRIVPATAVNVAGVYAALRDDINGNTRRVADFDDAVRTQMLMQAILDAAASGIRAAPPPA